MAAGICSYLALATRRIINRNDKKDGKNEPSF